MLMQKSLFALALCILVLSSLIIAPAGKESASAAPVVAPPIIEAPLALAETVPEAAESEEPAREEASYKPAASVAATPGTPLRVRIPAIRLNNPVIPVGVNAKGEMDVPDGTTNNVGWYKGGTLPGAMGSAVLDAHVYAAFGRLDEVSVGDDIYVQTAEGELHFKVEETRVYKLADVPATRLFNRADDRRLNLITCAGTLVADRSTYTHRLVVYATLVS